MTEENQDKPTEAERWLMQAWTTRLTEVLEAMSGERPQVQAEAGAGEPSGGGEAIWWKQTLDLADNAFVLVGAPEATWMALGKRSLQAAGVEDGAKEDFQATYEELLQQALAGLAQSIGGQANKEVTCTEKEQLSTPPEAPLTLVNVAYPGQEPLPLYIVFSPELRAALMPAEPAGQPRVEIPAEQTKGPLHSSAAPSTAASGSQTVELLLDVELPVSVSFGRAYLPLRDVLKLSSGSIVELNRSVSDPVEVIVNNCVIARGDVVVVDGNYGVRVTQIISRQERLRTLN